MNQYNQKYRDVWKTGWITDFMIFVNFSVKEVIIPAILLKI